MSMLRILVVDDEPLIRSGIRNSLSSLADVDVIGESGSGTQAIEAIVSQGPDLVFLDVQMPDCSGLEVVRRVGSALMPAVVFVTAYDEYAVKAFELNAVDYLLKPFDESRLHATISRVRDRIASRDQAQLTVRLQALLDSSEQRWAERIVVRNGERFDFVPVDSIDWIESANNYVQLHCATRQHLLSETLTSIEKRLDPRKFRRVHRCRIVNLSRIVAVHPMMSGAYEMELRGGTRLATGRQYRDAVQELIRH